MAQADLLEFAEKVEDIASALHAFRENLPRGATKITSTISELFSLSAVLRELDDAQGSPRQAPSFYRIQDDLEIVVPSLQRTITDIRNMLARSEGMPYQMVWDDLRHRMESDEGIGLNERLRWYSKFMRAQLDILNGYQPSDLRELRRELKSLWNAQQASDTRLQKRPTGNSHMSSPSTPKAGPSRPPILRMETPVSAATTQDDWDGLHRRPGMPPPVPDPPNVMPQSPTFTSSSSNTLNSSQTSYSSNDFAHMTPALVHWAQDVFDGENPKTRFRNSYQAQDPSKCCADVQQSSVQHLIADGFIEAVEIPFDQNELLVRFYFRPLDSRARILVIIKPSPREEYHHCTPLINLRVIRKGSTLSLCRVKKQGKYELWVRLNFYLYERMVLFYNTFVAMKRQDRREVPHEDLLDDFELQGPNPEEAPEEKMEFGGVIKDGHYRHALRLFRDRGSGVVRIEASALRGPMMDVPLWTAFVTKYANDPDWAHLEPNGVVNLAALKPPPYVFLSGYQPPRRGHEYLLQFDKRIDAEYFVETWTGLCRSGGR